MNKKAQMGNGRKYFSFFLGLIFLVFGLLPLLNGAGIIKFTLPTLPSIILWILALIGGIVLFIDASKEAMGMGRGIMIITIIIGILVFIFGLIPLLVAMNVLNWNLPAFVNSLTEVLFTAAGIFLIIGAFKGY
ncbi:MAG: hypothetical protein QXG00_03190 [Candidatus Woesearchaeota archaeon]